MFFDPETRELLRTRPSPLTWDQARKLRGARPAGPPPRPSAEPVTAQRVASNTGVIMVAGQKIALGRIHARQIVTVRVAADTITIDLASDDTRIVRRTTTQPVRSIKAQQPRREQAGRWRRGPGRHTVVGRETAEMGNRASGCDSNGSSHRLPAATGDST
jgi:hypothetical protein